MRLPTVLMFAGAALFLAAGCGSSGILQVHEGQQKRENLIWVEATAQVNSPVQDLWKLLGEEFDKNSKYTHNITDSHYIDKKPGVVGSIRTATESSGQTFDVKVVAYEPNERFIEWEIVRAEAPIETGIGSYRLEDLDGRTRVTFKGGFKMKYFFMDWLAKRQFPHGFKAIVAGIKLRAEEGRKLADEDVDRTIERYGDQLTAHIL